MMRLIGFLISLALAPVALAGEAAGPGAAPGAELEQHVAEDASAPPVTPANVMESERFWPYHVRLREAWQPEGAERPLRAGKVGVLIRVIDPEKVRVDFGGYGQYDLAMGQTNLLEEANRVRTGERQKMGPNFALALGPRLLAPSEGRFKPYPYSEAVQNRAFLCVFADPLADDFPALAAALRPLAEREGLLTIFLPQGGRGDEEVRERLIASDWPVPFVYDYLTGPYTSSLVGEDPTLPTITLQTNEGRLLFEDVWSEPVTASLRSAVDGALGAAGLAAREAPTKP
jgi:hypothetical protein